MNGIKDKVVVITGAAQGIGKAAVLKFAGLGAAVAIWDVNPEKGNELANQLNSENKKAVFVKVDVTKPESVEAAVKQTVDALGTIDVLVNNAGITKDSSFLKMTAEQWQLVIDVNLTGVFNVTKAVAPLMVEKKSGRIINTSSIVGLYGNFGQTNYVATKSGIVGMTKVWARELGRKGVNVNAVAPGFIATDMVSAMPETVLATYKEKTPLGRLGKPEDIANAYLFLASDEASFINGAVLSVDGGLVM
jgi:3-oxoacyl-[acyl-carrier protein] reductase